MDSFEQELKQGFLEEASQLLSDAEQCFLSLESNPGDSAILEKIFRLAHNLKGSSKAVGFDSLGAFTHEFENLLLKLKNGELSASSGLVTLLLRCNDHLRVTIDTLRADLGANVDHSAIQAEVEAAIHGQLVDAAPATEPEPAAPVAASEAPVTDASIADLTTSMLEVAPQAEVVPMPVAPAPAHHAAPKAEPAKQAADESIRVSLSRLEKLLNFVGEMVILQTVLREQANSDNQMLLRRTVHQLGKVGKEIQDISMSLRMVPLKQTFQKMQRIVRDTSNILGKKVNLTITGEETELDKTVLEAVSDPLVHLIRNAVDHGIESNAARVQAGKPEAGTVHLGAFHQGGKLVIEVRDDGGGIDPDRLMAKAREKGVIHPGQNLTRDQAVNLIFAAGFSTKAEVTEVSGRGVGMDVVKTNIEKLQGEIQVKTEVGKGTTFSIFLPLTLAIIDGMVVTLGSNRYVIPLSHVHESLQPKPEDVKSITGLGEVLLLRGENLPLYRLSSLLGGKPDDKRASDGIALVVRIGAAPFAVLVDDIIGQFQVVIKQLGLEMQHLKGYSGSAILGDGKPALILELAEMIRSRGDTQRHSNSSVRRATA